MRVYDKRKNMKDSGIHSVLCPITTARYEVGGSLQYLVHWFFYFFFRKLYINLHMAGLHFHKLDLWQHSHTKHANTQAYVNQIWEDFMTAAIFNRVTGPTGFRKRGFSRISVARGDTNISEQADWTVSNCKAFFYFFFPCFLHFMHRLVIRYPTKWLPEPLVLRRPWSLILVLKSIKIHC